MVGATYKANFSGLQELNKAMKQKMRTKVGILSGSGSRTDENGVSNATLGLVHEMGSATKNIPARSFLRMPIQFKADAIQNDVLKRKPAIERAMADGDAMPLYDTLGLSAVAYVQMAFESGGFGQWKPLSSKTVAQKGSSSPLIDTGQLRESITWEVKKG